MENTTENNAGQTNSPTGISAPSAGELLREARERLGLSVMDVASQIKFAPRQIEALEADDYEHLPEAAFVRGFVRSYAKVLHLDAQPLLAALPQKKQTQGDLVPEPVGEPFTNIHSLLRQNLVWLSGALLLGVIVAGFAFWHFTTPPEQAQAEKVESPVALHADIQITPPASEVPEAPVIEPVEQKPQASAQSAVPAATTVAPRPAPQKQAATAETPSDTSTPVTSLRLEFSEDSWAEIKDKDGKILSSRLHVAGSELTVNGHAPFSLLIGHASTVRLQYQDKEINLAPHTRRSTDVASLTLE